MNIHYKIQAFILTAFLVSTPLMGAQQPSSTMTAKVDSKVKSLDDSNFDGVIANGTVIVDFYADWCGPCKKLAPFFEKAAGEMSNKATFAKVNIDNAPKTASKYHIATIPTVIVFKDGKEVRRRTGGSDQQTIRDLTNSL